MEKEKLEKVIYLHYLKSGNDIKKIEKIASLLGITIKEFYKILKSFIENNKEVARLNDIYEYLMLLNDNESIITYLNTTNVPISILNNNVINYLIEYRTDLLIEDETIELKLKRKIHIYEDYLSEKKKQNSNTIDYQTINISYNILTKYLNTPYSLERFCAHESINKVIFKNAMNCIKKYLNTLYNECLTKLDNEEKVKENDLKCDVINITEMIKDQNNDFTVIDFLSSTKYSPRELMVYADRILPFDEQKLFRRKISPFRNIKKLNETGINNLLLTTIQYNIDDNVIVVNQDLKKQIINDLKEKDIPISMETFKEACKKIVRNKTNMEK